MAEEELIEKIAGRVVARLGNAPKPQPGTENRYVNDKGAAKFLGVSAHTLRAWRSKKPPSGPSVTRIGKMVLYSLKELERFMEERTEERR
jgi:predicted DNA-binding transcriptional regulator AlpA